MSPRLSICIATLNRAAFLGETLESIAAQASESIELVILDGGSKDATPTIIETYGRRFSRFKYIRQEFPGGVDQDFNRAVEEASGDYCWLMSDDDLLKPGAIQEVLKRLLLDPDLVVVNAEVRDPNLFHLLRERMMPLKEDLLLGPESRAELFAAAADYLSFIGGVVIRRSLWNSRDRQRYFGTLFVHVGVIFQAPLPAKAILLADPLISIRYGNALWSAKSFEIWMFKWPALIWSFDGLEDSVKRGVCPREPWKKLGRLIRFRGTGGYALAEYRTWISGRAVPLLHKWMLGMIARIPGSWINALLLLAVTLRGRWRLLYIDLINSPYYWRRYFGWKGRAADLCPRNIRKP